MSVISCVLTPDITVAYYMITAARLISLPQIYYGPLHDYRHVSDIVVLYITGPLHDYRRASDIVVLYITGPLHDYRRASDIVVLYIT